MNLSDNTPRMILELVMPKLHDKINRPLRPGALKLVMLAIWASGSQPISYRDLAQTAGVAPSQCFRALEALDAAGLIIKTGLGKWGRGTYVPRYTYAVNRERIVKALAGTWPIGGEERRTA